MIQGTVITCEGSKASVMLDDNEIIDIEVEPGVYEMGDTIPVNLDNGLNYDELAYEEEVPSIDW